MSVDHVIINIFTAKLKISFHAARIEPRPVLVHANVMAAKKALGKVSGVLLDLSGTLFVEKSPTPGALAALEKSAKPTHVAFLI